MASQDGKNFSHKFSFSLEKLELSNIAASKLLNIDASYVSRIKHGTRVPKSDSELILLISERFGDLIWEKNLVNAFLPFLHITEINAGDKKAFLQAYKNWLTDNSEDLEISYAIDLMESIQTYSEIFSVIELPENPEESLLDLKLSENKVTYYGPDGLLEAALHLFVDTANYPCGELQLYSEHPVSWLTNDEEQEKIVQSLAAYSLRKGVKFKVLHFLQRGVPELIEGFRIWIPLYFMGEIESYYRISGGENTLCHTLLNHKDHRAVHGMCIRGAEEDGLYSYIKQKKALKSLSSSFDSLIEKSHPLISSVPSNALAKEILNKSDEKIIVVISSLPLEALSPELLDQMLQRGVDNLEERNRIVQRIHDARSRLDELLLNNDVSVLMYEHERNMPCIFAEIPIFNKVPQLTYAENEWEQHFQDTSNYFRSRDVNFLQTSDELTRNTNILSFADCVFVNVNQLSEKTFMFSQPAMVEAMNILFHRLGHANF